MSKKGLKSLSPDIFYVERSESSGTKRKKDRAATEPGDSYGGGAVRPLALFFALDVW